MNRDFRLNYALNKEEGSNYLDSLAFTFNHKSADPIS